VDLTLCPMKSCFHKRKYLWATKPKPSLLPLTLVDITSTFASLGFSTAYFAMVSLKKAFSFCLYHHLQNLQFAP
jgi:hypothetical protein